MAKTGSSARTRAKKKLKALVLKSLRQQGYELTGSRPVPPPTPSKAEIRALHAPSVAHTVGQNASRLGRDEEKLIQCIAYGHEVDPGRIQPKLVLVTPRSDEEKLFRYAALHWSVPVSSGYGRRLRYLIVDASNDKLMGIIGLCDPVFNIGVRDKWIGWNLEQRKARLQQVMDAFVLGAVQPYSQLLLGKFIAMALVSEQIQQTFRKKYAASTSRIAKRRLANRLALITTTSALGRSSLYNRVALNGRPLLESIGFTQGYGTLHFTNGVYDAVSQFARQRCEPTERHRRWGGNRYFRNRREVIYKSLNELGLTLRMTYHGVQREFFAAPLATNAREFLRGEQNRLHPQTYDLSEIFCAFRERWLLPRAQRQPAFRAFDRESYRLWK